MFHIKMIEYRKKNMMTQEELADRLVACGVKGLWNFAPMDLKVPDDIIVENVNLTESLFTLSYLMNEECE